MSVAFPLILTFSLREKEQQLNIPTFAMPSDPLAAALFPLINPSFPCHTSDTILFDGLANHAPDGP
jgi:hypothetical protein